MAQRELVFFDMEEAAAKKKKASSKKGASSAAKKTSASGKTSAAKSKTTASKPKAGTAKSKTDAAKPKTGTTKSKSTASETKPKASKAASAGTKKGASASKKDMKNTNNATAKKKSTSKKKLQVEENPLSRSQSAVLYAANQENPKRTSAQSAPKSNKPKRSKKRPMDGLTALLALCLAGIAALGIWRFSEYQNFLVMKQAVSSQTFYSGTTVEGIDVSGMTLPQALSHWESQIEPNYQNRAVVFDDGTRVTAAQLGYSSDYADVLSSAWSAGRSGSLEERYAHMTGRMDANTAYSVSRSFYTEELVKRCAEAFAQQIDSQPSAASIASFDTNSYRFSFTEGKPGRTLDRQKLVEDIKRVISAGGGEVSLSIASIAPSQTKAEMEAQYGLICYAVTNASSSSSNRLTNIKRALELINGTCLKPGESFSFNQTVGQRTGSRGFKVATAYSAGEVTEQVGGGICQVSTTLWNAAVKADLKIDERHPHSLTVGYVDLGKDAAVDWSSKDLRFTNNGDDAIYICCYLTDDKRIRFGIFGKLLPNGESITIEGVQTGVVEYQTERQVNFTMASGESKVVQKGKNGYTATTYKIRWDANGKQISREELCKSRYSATREIVEYGP